jgi:hypothetical protein
MPARTAPPLEREAELDELQAGLEQARAGRGRLVVLEGAVNDAPHAAGVLRCRSLPHEPGPPTEPSVTGGRKPLRAKPLSL